MAITAEKRIRVLVVDDSPTFLAIIKDILRKFKSIEDLCFVSSGIEAIEKTRSFDPHLIFMDLMMPGISGLEALAKIRERNANVDVVIISGAAEDAAQLTIEAIKQGALDFVAKPVTRSLEEMEDYFLARLSPFIRRAAYKQVCLTADAASLAPTYTPVEVQKPKEGFPGEVKLVVVGVSTGAPNTLPSLVSSLPADLPVPVLALVDVPKVFLRFLGRLLLTSSAISISEAKEGDRLSPSRILVAPSTSAIQVVPDGDVLTLRLSEVAGQTQLLDKLLFSVADALPAGCLTAVMSGFGTDGSEGVTRLRNTGDHYCLVQSPESCTAPDRPSLIIDNELADEVVSLENMGRRITELAKKSK